jgi:DNA replication and repair protein RecF
VEVRLERLKLFSFRNFEKVDLTFPQHANLLIGANGAGKSNLLEAIHYLSLARSQRGARDSDAVGFGHEAFRIEGMGRREERELLIEIAFSSCEKVISVNASRVSASDLVGTFPVVSLSSDDIETTRGMPGLRRRFVDMIMSFMKPSYLGALTEYRKVLRQRNRILADARDRSGSYETLSAWDPQLIELGSELIRSRVEFASLLSESASRLYGRMAPASERYELSYEPSIPVGDSSIERSFALRLEEFRHRERERGMTLVGPHRDDYSQRLNGKDMRRFSSEGQQRTASLSLKLAGAELVYQETGEWPVLLFDEVFAELDRGRCELIGELVHQFDQVFIATATADTIPRLESHAFLVERGDVRSAA